MINKVLSKAVLLTQSHISLALLVELSIAYQRNPEITLGSFVERFCQDVGLASQKGKNIIFTQGAVLGTLYVVCMIAEGLQKDILNKISLGDIKLFDQGCIKNFTGDKNLYKLIDHIRNAIAHNDFDITENFDTKFRHIHQGKIKFEANFTLEDIREILYTITRNMDIEGLSDR